MLYNYLKIAFRNLWKNKLFSFINIMGLGLAIPFALLSLLQLQSTFEFDNFHPDPERVFRILTNEKTLDGGTTKYASSPYLLSENLKEHYACIENSTKVIREFGWELNNQIKILEVNTIYVEPDFFEIFGFHLANGSVPIEANNLVLSHETAQNFFRDVDPIGKVLTHPTYGPFKITGVLKPFKKQTQFRSDIMVSMASYVNTHKEIKKPESWATYQAHTFVKIHPKSKPQALDLALADILRKSNTYLSSAKKTHTFRKQALKDISPSMEELRFNPYVDSISDLYFNFFIPLMILLLAGFNYTNLTLAHSLSRTKEVGVRKMMGAVRRQLITQFICEAIIIALLALTSGLVILSLMKQFIHVQWVTWEVENQTFIWFAFVLFALILGFSAGIMPAWILSGFQPVSVLKGILGPASFGKVNFRKSLIVIQLVVTMAFIFIIGHMYNQFEYMATENDNFNRRDIFNITLSDKSYQLLINDISKNKNIEKIGLTSMPFGSMTAQYALKKEKNAENIATFYYAVDPNFIENMKLTLVAGQNLPATNPEVPSFFILINETAVSKLRLGTPREAIGKTIILNDATEMQVVGVLKDFCHLNYQFKKEPVVFQYNPAHFQVLSVKTSGNISEDEFLAQMQTSWKKYYPHEQMVYSWYEKDMYERYFPAEDMKMMGIAALVIFVIALMGLVGMVTYSTQKRVKEIGVRKVMGASIWEVTRLLSWSFTKLLMIASLIALPVGYISGVIFVNLFTFHAGINLSLMAFFFGLVFLTAISAIAYHAIKAALANPVKSLRNE